MRIKKMKIKKIGKILLRYHFLVIFGVTFAVYLSVITVQAVCAPGRGAQTPEENQSMAGNEPGQKEPGTQPETASQPKGTDPADGATQAPAVPPETQTEHPTDSTPTPPSGERTFEQADMSYLDGALFIGDSRTITLSEYAGWDNTHFFVETGLTIWTVMDAPIAKVNGAKVTVDEALQTQRYDKIYIQLGINELGRGTPDSFTEQYEEVLTRIRELQPQAVIYIQSIMHVSQSKDDQNTYINNGEVNARNEKLKNLADGIRVFWLDENEVFDEPGTGKLNPEYTSDGVHLKPKYIPVWQEFLLSHTIRI